MIIKDFIYYRISFSTKLQYNTIILCFYLISPILALTGKGILTKSYSIIWIVSKNCCFYVPNFFVPTIQNKVFYYPVFVTGLLTVILFFCIYNYYGAKFSFQIATKIDFFILGILKNSARIIIRNRRMVYE